MEPLHLVYLKKIILSACALFLFLVSLKSVAALSITPENKTLARLKSQAIAENLALKEQWLFLGHYKKTMFARRYKSFIDDDTFFLAEDGKDSPQSELLATLDAFFANKILADGQSALCRYQVRYQWISEQLGLEIPYDFDANCNKFNKWLSRIKPEKITLIFPASYLNSPSSMFGHTLFRLDQLDKTNSAALVSYAINFGANLNPENTDLLYAYRGLAGGYPGNFVLMPYHRKVKEYNKMENRDIWEYELNLTAEETGILARHLWEVGDSNFDYYFLDENCSYRLLELLDIVRPEARLAEKFPFTVVPSDTVRAIVDADMVASTHFRPSSASRLKASIETLDNTEKDLVLNLAGDINILESYEYEALPEKRKFLVADTAFQLVRYQETEKKHSEGSANRSWQLLNALNQYDQANHVTVPIPVPAKPESGHDTWMWGVNEGYQGNDGRQEDQWYGDLAFRFTYHGLTDNEYGYLRGAQITMGDIVFRKREDDGFSLQKFDVINIQSLSPRNRFFKPVSWRVRTGMDRVFSLDNFYSLATYAEGGFGATYTFSENSMSFGLLTARVEYNEGYNTNFVGGAGIELGHLWYLPGGVLKIVAGLMPILNQNDVRSGFTLEKNFVINHNNAIRFKASRQLNRNFSATQTQIGYYHYF